jgi:hypothetical protein
VLFLLGVLVACLSPSCWCAALSRRMRAARRGIAASAADARMQDTAEGFGQPIKQIFEPIFRIERHVPTRSTSGPLRGAAGDKLWRASTCRSRASPSARRRHRRLQRGRIHIYLLYSFVTLLVLLVFVR